MQRDISQGGPIEPLTVTVAKACELSGFGPTSIWAFLKDHRLEAVRVSGVRRTLISYRSLIRFLGSLDEVPTPRRRCRPRKSPTSQEQTHHEP
jgi:hypothetical protein